MIELSTRRLRLLDRAAVAAPLVFVVAALAIVPLAALIVRSTVLEAVGGQLYIAVTIARLVGAQLQRRG